MNENMAIIETGNSKKKYDYANHWVHTKSNDGKLLVPPLEVLNLLFDYDTDSGSFKRKFDMRFGAIEHREITDVDSYNYRRVGITDSTGKMKMYKIHRLAYFMHTGNQIPMGMQVDHRDGDTLNNRFENFRVVSNKVNSRNARTRSDNTSGYKEVNFHKQMKKWRARITFDDGRKYIGLFDTPEQANAARLEAIGRYNLYHLDKAYSYRHTNSP